MTLERVTGRVALGGVATILALQAWPSAVADGKRDAIRWTAWYVVILCGFYGFVWGSAADHAYEISERFTRHVMVGMFLLSTGVYGA